MMKTFAPKNCMARLGLPAVSQATPKAPMALPVKLLLLLLTTAPLVGCQSAEERDAASEPEILASFHAIQLIVEPLTGDIPVSTILRPGTSPHAYAPRPSEAVRMQKARLVVYAHDDIDGWVAEMAGGRARALFGSVDDGVDIRIDAPSVEDDAHDAIDSDPSSHAENEPDHHEDAHFWVDPVRINQALMPLADVLCQSFRNECAAIRRRATVQSVRLDSLNRALEARAIAARSAGSDRCVITAQPFADQMLSRYDIPFVGPISVSADVPPSPGRLARITAEAAERGCRFLVVQSALQNRLEKRLAREEGWELIEVDPLGGSASDLESYLSSLFNVLTQMSDESPADPS